MAKQWLLQDRLQLTEEGNLEGKDIQMTPPCVDATVTVTLDTADQVTVEIQLLDANGDPITYVEHVWVGFWDSPGRTSPCTAAPSTGVAAGTDGAIDAVVEAHKMYRFSSETDGDIDFTWTDTGADEVYVGVTLPTGRVVMGSRSILTT